MNLIRKHFTLLAALVAIAAFAAGCGDDEKSDAADTASQAQTAAETTADEAADDAQAAAGEIDEATLREFIDAINEDPSIICDPDNATQDLLDQLGGEEACKEASAQEEGGGKYSIDDLQVDGDTATATITDDDSTDTVTFVQEGDQIKISGSEEG